MSQFHVNINVVTDTAEAAIGLSEASGMRLQDILEQPFVTHLSTSITRTGDQAEEPTTRDRIVALIDYLGEERALKALDSRVEIDVAKRDAAEQELAESIAEGDTDAA